MDDFLCPIVYEYYYRQKATQCPHMHQRFILEEEAKSLSVGEGNGEVRKASGGRWSSVVCEWLRERVKVVEGRVVGWWGCELEARSSFS